MGDSMPGPYAHITLVNLAKNSSDLESLPDFPVKAITSILDYFKFCELGAVSPDYPYLAIGDSSAQAWADKMHYINTGEMIKVGINNLKDMEDDSKSKCVAWLMGYASHVVADVFMHPVVNKIVGPYEQNKTHHRVCEMNQDSFIFQRLNIGAVDLSSHFETGIWACSDNQEEGTLDKDVVALWSAMLNEVYPEEYNNNAPYFNKWHSQFKLVINDIATHGNLIPFGRHLADLVRNIADNIGIQYPKIEDIQEQYIQNIPTPNVVENYDVLFDRAIQELQNIWNVIGRGIYSNSEDYLTRIGNWDLDSGKEIVTGQMVFWDVA